jgi:hypothetical protein
MADLLIRCHKGDRALSLELMAIWQCNVFWLAFTVRRKSAPCSWRS